MRVICFLLIFVPFAALAQVGEIKKSSSANSASHGTGAESGGSSSGASFFFDIFFNGLGQWQKQRLQKESEQPSISSVEFYLQSAIQPSRYYVLWPRVRGNWGIFSTDFRINYLIEDDLDGYQHLSTSDWQIVQLNIIDSRYVTGRIGYGIMHENFSEGETFGEFGTMVFVHTPDHHVEGGLEYRVARDYATGAVPRRECSVQLQRRVLSHGRLQGYVTGGGTFQRYYGATDVWGFTAGICMKIF